jgi:methylated-DNA-[protein]-cysteine S-methyltransferase
MTSHLSKTIFASPVGRILLYTSESHLHCVELLFSNVEVETKDTLSTLAQKTVEQFHSYFTNAQTEWTLPIIERGTVFQKKVWRHLQTIPVGETQSYSEIAQILGTSARAVGNACRANPLAIIVPCHRVVSKSGIGGYYGKRDGSEINLKQWLLSHESNHT